MCVDELQVMSKQPHPDAVATMIRVRTEKAQIEVIDVSWVRGLKLSQEFEERVGSRPQVFEGKLPEAILQFRSHFDPAWWDPDGGRLSSPCDPGGRVRKGTLEEEPPECAMVVCGVV